MKGYYFINHSGSEYLYVPLVLFSYRHLEEYHPRNKFSPEVLRKFCLAQRNGKLNRYSLEKKKWDFEEMDIPDKIIKDFINSCFRGRSKRRLNSRASKIFEWAFSNSVIAVKNGLRDDDNYEYEPDEITKVHEGGYREIIPVEDEEDYEDGWWLRGDKPPFFS